MLQKFCTAFSLFTVTMSDVLSAYKKAKIEWQLKLTTELASHYGNKMEAQGQEFAFCAEIPYPLLQMWGNLLDQNPSSEVNFVELFNLTVPGGWYALKRDCTRLNELLRKNASRVKALFSKTKGRKYYNLKKEVYVMNVRKDEVESVSELKADVEMYQQEIKEWREKYSNLEEEKKKMYEEMKKEMKDMEEEIKEINEVNEQLKEYIETLEKNESLKCQGKKINEVGSKQKGRKLKHLKNKAKCALWFSKTFGLELDKLTFRDGDNNMHCFDYHTDSGTGYNNLSSDDKNKMEQVLFLLDKFCVGDEVYHELSLASNDSLPKSYLIKQLRSDLNKTYHIERTPGKYTGARLDFSSTLSSHIRELLIAKPELENQAINVKLSGDGARMSRTTNFMMFSFALLQKDESVMSSKSNRTVAIVNGPEEYKTLKTSLSTLFDEINGIIDLLTIDGKKIKLNFFLGGDMKFLLMIMGMNAASSYYACLWCKIHKDDRWDVSKASDFYQSEAMKRTLKDLQELCHSKEDNYGCINEPLLKIELSHVVPDELHLLLRVTDVLLKNVVDEAMERDAAEDHLKIRGERKGIHLEALTKSINDLGISFSIWNKKNADGSESKLKEFTSLLGSQKKKLLHELPSKMHLFLNPDTCATVKKIWNEFGDIYDMLSDFSLSTEASTELFSKGKSWIELFCSLRGIQPGYLRERVTPYMHLIPYHIPYFVQLHGCLKKFTGQGVEKNNADAKTILFQKSNKWDAASDILCTESRQWDLRHHERVKAQYVKRKLQYWGQEICEKRKERRVVSQVDELEEQETVEVINNYYNQYTMKQLKQIIIEKKLTTKGISKLKKKELITFLKNNVGNTV